MPQQIVFPCPSCGATQSVDDTVISFQCQFCGSTISVPEELRPKTPPAPPPSATPTTYSIGGGMGTPMPAIPGLPSMFMNMDLNKLRDMAMASRAGNVDQAAQLYSEAFGVPLDQARQAAQLMAQHHHVVLNQTYTQLGGGPVISMGSAPQVIQQPSGGVTYNLPSPMAAPPSTSRVGRAGSTCLSLVVTLIIIAGIGIGALAIVFAASPNLLVTLSHLFK